MDEYDIPEPNLVESAKVAELQNGETDSYSFAHRQDTILQLSLMIDDILERIEHSWKGEHITIENGQAKWDKMEGVKPAMNDKGINSIMGLLRKFGNRVHALSKYNEDEIYSAASSANHEVNKMLAMNFERWEVDITQYSEICFSASYFIFSVLKQAEDGMTRQLAMTMTKRTEVSDESPQKQGGGLMNLFYRGGKK